MTVVASQFEYVVSLLAKQVYTKLRNSPHGSQLPLEVYETLHICTILYSLMQLV